MSLIAQQKRPPQPAVAAGPARPLRRATFPVMGTVCELQFVCEEADRAAQFENAARLWLAEFEGRYSRFRPESVIGRINAAAGREWVEVDAEMEQMLDFSAALFFHTQGTLDVTALPLMRLWDYRQPQPTPPTAAQIAAARELVGWAKVERIPGQVFLPKVGMALDFGGWGKEYAVDAVAEIARQCGLTDVLVDIGHDLRCLGAAPGKPAWHVGLENPAAPGSTWGSIAVRDKSVASSGDYLRGFTHEGKRYGHIIDPRTGRPVANGCTQVTVVAGSCVQAGMLSTAAFILGQEAGLRLIQETQGAEGCILAGKTRGQTRGFFNYVVQS